MSFDVLIQGKLKGGVTVRSSKSGRPFATFKLSTTDKANNQLWVSAITFSESAIEVLERLKEGDSVAMSGEAAISTWNANDGTTRYGLDVTAHQVMSAYHAGRKRGTKAKATSPEHENYDPYDESEANIPF